MRYGNPSIEAGLNALNKLGVDDVFIIPLYPQHAMATTETIMVLAEELKNKYFPKMRFTSLPSFYNHPDYIRVLANTIQDFLKGNIFEMKDLLKEKVFRMISFHLRAGSTTCIAKSRPNLGQISAK